MTKHNKKYFSLQFRKSTIYRSHCFSRIFPSVLIGIEYNFYNFFPCTYHIIDGLSDFRQNIELFVITRCYTENLVSVNLKEENTIRILKGNVRRGEWGKLSHQVSWATPSTQPKKKAEEKMLMY